MVAEELVSEQEDAAGEIEEASLLEKFSVADAVAEDAVEASDARLLVDDGSLGADDQDGQYEHVVLHAGDVFFMPHLTALVKGSYR